MGVFTCPPLHQFQFLFIFLSKFGTWRQNWDFLGTISALQSHLGPSPELGFHRTLHLFFWQNMHLHNKGWLECSLSAGPNVWPHPYWKGTYRGKESLNLDLRTITIDYWCDLRILTTNYRCTWNSRGQTWWFHRELVSPGLDSIHGRYSSNPPPFSQVIRAILLLQGKLSVE